MKNFVMKDMITALIKQIIEMEPQKKTVRSDIGEIELNIPKR